MLKGEKKVSGLASGGGRITLFPGVDYDLYELYRKKGRGETEKSWIILQPEEGEKS